MGQAAALVGGGPAGPAVTAAFLLANIFVVRIPEITDFGDWQTGLSLMALGATAYLAAAGMFMPVHWGLRVLMVAGVAAAYLAVWSAQDVSPTRRAPTGWPAPGPARRAHPAESPAPVT